MAILLVALLIRAGAAWLSGVAAPQEIRYIAIAQGLLGGRGFEGIDTRFPDIIQPPLYPALVALAIGVSPDPLAAARGVSVLAGTLLVAVLWILTRRVFGRDAAIRAAWIAAVYPLLVHISGLSMTEPTFSLLIAIAALLAHRIVEGEAGIGASIACGLLLGLGFLTRPEGLAYVAILVPILFLLYRASRRMSIPAALRTAAIPALVVLAFAAPYAWWLHARTGHWLISPKALLTQIHNGIMQEGAREGWPERPGSTLFYERVKFSLTEDGTEMRSADAFRRAGLLPGAPRAVRTTAPGGLDALDAGALTGIVRRNLRQLYLDTIKYGLVIPTLLIGFLALGMTAEPWRPGPRRRGHLLLLGFFLSGFSWLLSYVQPRFLYPSVTFLIPWMAEGWVRAERWFEDSFGDLRGRPAGAPPSRWLAGAIALAVALACVVHTVEPTRQISSQWAEHRIAGLWLREHGPGPGTIMALTPVMPFYAGMSFDVLPYENAGRVVAYARRQSARYLVADAVAFPNYRPQLLELLDPEAPHPGLRPIRVVGERPERRVVVYEIERADPGAAPSGAPPSSGSTSP